MSPELENQINVITANHNCGIYIIKAIEEQGSFPLKDGKLRAGSFNTDEEIKETVQSLLKNDIVRVSDDGCSLLLSESCEELFYTLSQMVHSNDVNALA